MQTLGTASMIGATFQYRLADSHGRSWLFVAARFAKIVKNLFWVITLAMPGTQ